MDNHIATLFINQCGASASSINRNKDMSNWHMFMKISGRLVRTNALHAVHTAKRQLGADIDLYIFSGEFKDYDEVLKNAKHVGTFVHADREDIFSPRKFIRV